MKKNLVKILLTTAMVTTMFICRSNEAKACDYCGSDDLDAFAAAKGTTCAKVLESPVLFDEYASAIFEADGGLDAFLNTLNVAAESYTQKDMLALVNADRAANGAGALVWSADLEVIAHQRAVEAMAAEQSAEMAAAIAAGDVKAQNKIAHAGMRAGTSENEAWVEFSGYYTYRDINASWIESSGHHANRIKTGWTQYAVAFYIDPVTNQETWIEVFADNSFKGASSFDYIRYAAEYPDLAAAFGQDRNALYNHYLTNGKIEGRKAYYTDGTAIKM